ncbi:MAG: hypothetical protein WA208_14650 [Thermoanaerobaculia bacterium]
MTTRDTTAVLTRKRFALFAAAAYVVAYVVALGVSETSVPDAVKFALSVIAVGTFGVLLIAELRLTHELDELQQRIQLEALAFAFPLSVGVVMLLGLLQRFWVLPVEDASYRHIWPVMIIFYAIGLARARRRY